MSHVYRRDEFVAAIVPVVKAAGRRVMELRQAAIAHTLIKPDGSPVTDADIQSQQILREGCLQIWPDVVVISEEGDAADPNLLGAKICIVIDPLDGTRDFLSGSNDFTINLAILESGRPTAGIIYAPARDELYFSNGAGETFFSTLRPGADRPSHASFDAGLRVLVSKFHADPDTLGFVDRLGRCQVRAMGSALKFARIASGDADLYVRLSPLMVWDYVAGQAIIDAAGACLVDHRGKILQDVNVDSWQIGGIVAARTPDLAAIAVRILSTMQKRSPHEPF